ncbi:MAG: aminotransferase class V-fold PLP-dependent enzyme [Bacteroidetes bacterium]|nr:aminotransferase class V-fold PLP-dependent enzyme [Bacteroidota bacterium]
MDSFTNAEGFKELERGVRAALETYSNVHRGSGHYSMATTHLFEQARDIILEFLELDKRRYIVIFCTTARAYVLKAMLEPGSYTIVSGRDTGLCLGVSAMAVKRKALPKGAPFQTGGGTAKLIAPGWVMWADAPDKFEAGTPAIINIIAFAKAFRMIRHNGKLSFTDHTAGKLSAEDILYRDDLEGYSGHELFDRLRQTLVGHNNVVSTTEGDRPFINLDNAASTPTFEPVWEAVCRTWCQPLQVQQEIIHEVRSICSKFLGAPQDEYDLIFTSNTTEAINLAAENLSREAFRDTETVILNTILEHSSNELPWRMYPGFSLIRLGVDDEGMVDLNELETLMSAYNRDGMHGKKRIRLVAVSGASNVLGVFNKLEEISSIVHRYGARMLVDAAQMVAHRKVNMQAGGFDYLAFSAHKMYAPFGTGMLVVRKGLPGFSSPEADLIRSSGEENAGGIAALGKVLILLQRIGLDLIREEEQALTKQALHDLSQIRGLTIYGIKDPDSPRFNQKGGVILFNLKGVIATRLAKELALQGGIGVRSGCHCAHLIIKQLLHFTPTLEVIQRTIVTLFPRITLPGLVRISLGIENTREDIDTLIRVLGNIAAKPKMTSADTNTISTVKGTSALSRAKVKQQMNEFVEAAALRVYS